MSTNGHRVGSGFKNTAHIATRHYRTVASRHVLPMVDRVAATGVMLRRFLEGADERLP
jgi:hypothetical protein